jgi:hypothetical protein
MLPEFSKTIYTFKDIPTKREYLLDRLKDIYPDTDIKEITKILDSIKIRFREQEERGASNHEKMTVFLPLHDFENYSLKSKEDVIKYLENPKSTVTHEVTHIFQNLSKSFPHVQYLEKSPDSEDYEINYDKYWNDAGEKQSRFEQVRELLNWGFTKAEIISFLYNRKHDDRDLWRRIVDKAIELRKLKKGG